MTHGKVKTAALVRREGEVDLLRESVLELIKQERESKKELQRKILPTEYK